MKKLISLILVLVLAMSLAACGGEPAETSKPAASGNQPPVISADPGYTFKVGTTEIVMNANAADILTALGEPKSYTEEASCAFEGLDKTYFFGNFYLTTYPVGDEDFVYGLWLVDDSLSTPEGIYIGATQAEVEAAYGTEGFNGSNAYVMTKGLSKLTIILENGNVSSIQYDAVVE